MLPREPLVLDVGFNAGDFSFEVLAQRPLGKVIAFDPARSMQNRFAGRPNPEPRIELVPAAVSNMEATLNFHDSSDGESSLSGEWSRNPICYNVPVVTLDLFIAARKLEKIDLLKIDAEGHDLHVLEGASGLLDRQSIDILLFEYNATWIGTKRFLKEAAAYIGQKPYKLFRLYNGFVAPFQYSNKAERHDLGCMYIGISNNRLEQGGIPIRDFPN
jgi:FkbM family methyltransferase